MLVQEGNFSLVFLVWFGLFFLKSSDKEEMPQNQSAKGKSNRFEQQLCTYTEVNPEDIQFCTLHILKHLSG